MSLLDDARRLMLCETRYANESDAACGLCFQVSGHRSDCASLSLTKIVSALEAAFRLKAYRPTVLASDYFICQFCGVMAPDIPVQHEPACPWEAFRKALNE